MKLRYTILSIFLFLSVSGVMFGQSDDLQIFGYFQDNFHHTSFQQNIDAPPLYTYNSFNMQQMNIFFEKNFGPELSAFVNLEFTDSYSSLINVGGLNVQEAWLKYSPSAGFNIKAGLLIPRFDSFNEIKNRTVLLPYILRPLAYETTLAAQLNTSDFVPQQASVQVYGEERLGDVSLNYAAYMGNLTSDNEVKNGSSIPVGDDTTKFKMFGGRLGLESGGLSLGASGTYDRKDLWSMGNIGYVPRMRFGAYLNYSIAGFEFESEYIRVYNKLDDGDKATLAIIDKYSPLAPKGFNKYWYHVNLLYNFTDKLFAYAGHDYMISEDNVYVAQGVAANTFGGGYKINDAFVLKAQYNHMVITSYNVIKTDYLIGASIYF